MLKVQLESQSLARGICDCAQQQKSRKNASREPLQPGKIPSPEEIEAQRRIVIPLFAGITGPHVSLSYVSGQPSVRWRLGGSACRRGPLWKVEREGRDG
jgi:hypothetical protein